MLLVPEHTDTELEVEFSHIKAWASANCLHLNLSKTKEMVFRQPRSTYFYLPPAVDDIEQVNCCKLFGVIFQSNHKMDSHVHYIISQCGQHMYLLILLWHQGMSGEQLSVVTYSIIASRILYAYQRGVDFCLLSLRIRSMPFLGASSDLVARLATLQCQI